VLFDNFQERAAALAVRRFRIQRLSRRTVIRHYCIAQSPQFRIRNSVELHPEFQNRHRHQLGRVPVGAIDQTRAALIERGENQMQPFV
jgi:hypothetical protein